MEEKFLSNLQEFQAVYHSETAEDRLFTLRSEVLQCQKLIVDLSKAGMPHLLRVARIRLARAERLLFRHRQMMKGNVTEPQQDGPSTPQKIGKMILVAIGLLGISQVEVQAQRPFERGFCEAGSRVAWDLELTQEARERPAQAAQRMFDDRMPGATEAGRMAVERAMSEGRRAEAVLEAVRMAEAVTGETARSIDQTTAFIRVACQERDSILIPSRLVLLVAQICDLSKNSITAATSIICSVRPTHD